MNVWKLLITILSLAAYQVVKADWADPGAVYLCDKKAMLFCMKSVMDTSSPEDAGTVLPPPHYQPIHSAKNFKCTLGTNVISAHFEVEGAQSTGTCAGFRHTYI